MQKLRIGGIPFSEALVNEQGNEAPYGYAKEWGSAVSWKETLGCMPQPEHFEQFVKR